MARFTIPYQNIDVPLIDEGIVYRSQPGSGRDVVFTRVGNKILQLPVELYKGDVNNLPVRHPVTEGESLARRAGVLDYQMVTSTEQFSPAQPSTQQEVFTQNISKSNPQGIDVTSSKSGILATAPTVPTTGTKPPSAPQGVASIPPQTDTQKGFPSTAFQGPEFQASPEELARAQQQIGQIPAPLGTTERTNQLLQQASQKTGIPAQTFKPTVSIKPQTGGAVPPQTSQNAPGTTQMSQTTPGTIPSLEAPQTSVFDEVHNLLKEFGVNPPNPNQSPVSSAADIYKQFADMNNLFGAKNDIKELIDKQTKEISEVNENPFISEGLRSQKVSQIQNKYEHKLALLQSTFTRADEDARFLTGKYLEQVHQTQQATQDILFKGIDLAEKEISARRAEKKFETTQTRIESRFERSQALTQERIDAQESRFERMLSKRALKDQRADDKELNQKIQHIFNAKGKGESADDLKREIDEAVIADSMKEFLKMKVDKIYGTSADKGGFTFKKLGGKISSLFHYGE